MIDVFTGLLLVALIGGGFLIARRLFDRRNMMNPPMEMPWQSEYGPRDDYPTRRSCRATPPPRKKRRRGEDAPTPEIARKLRLRARPRD